ncbi:hypothetical protein [Burkholderia sp. HI2714]|uniref:hypothetical protein n=1 Tax=Burkholderia sp. HI2714 TaxID=2015359 RepID=UPI00117E8C15|nr:hypothetical protein [Burkholderia sp. HI2714]
MLASGFLSNNGGFIRTLCPKTLNHPTTNQTLLDDINGFIDFVTSRNPPPPPQNPEIIIDIFIYSGQL